MLEKDDSNLQTKYILIPISKFEMYVKNFFNQQFPGLVLYSRMYIFVIWRIRKIHVHVRHFVLFFCFLFLFVRLFF